MSELWLLVIVCSVTTYLWRALGVLLSGRIRTDSDIFNWAACVAYAMVSGLIMRIVVMPTGVLTSSLLSHRLLACAVGLAVFYLFRRNLFAAVCMGSATLTALNYPRLLLPS